MSFPRYPKYKASGVDWLGEVPEHWGVVPIKWLSPVKRGASPRPIDDPKYFDEEGEYAWVRIADVSSCDGDLNATTQRLSQLGSSLSVKIAPGELFISIAGTVGKPCISAIKACIHDGFVYFPTLKIEPRFLYRIFEGGVCYGGLGKWGTQLNLNTDTVGSIRVALPPTDEMIQVLEFLDRETKKIDELVAEQRRLMELLKEKRQALISHAVTKGLNPHAPMKPSGIEWLGDVPEGWEVKPLRSVFTFSKGLTITKEDLQDEGVQCVNYGEIHSKYGFRLNPDIHPLRCVAPEYLLTNPDARIQDGDFVFADTSEDLEGSGNFTHLRSESPIFAGYHTIIARPRKDTWSLFLAYQFHSSVFRSQIQRQVKGVKVFSISQGILKAAKCWLPPIPEQKAIATFLDTELSKFDTLTVEAQRTIELLQERRTALISAAVTGQIDVRQPPKN